MKSRSPLSQATSSSRWNQKPISRWAVSTESLAWTTFLRGDGDSAVSWGEVGGKRSRRWYPPAARPCPYLLTCMLKSPRMVPAAAAAEFVSPTMVRVDLTTL